MNRRNAYVENRRVLADSGELTGNIGIRDIITAFFIEFRATNGSSGNKANLLADCITSFELVDGSNTIVSLTGYQLAALTMFQRGYIPYSLITEVPSNVQNLVGEILFGRWHGDTPYALDPSKFSNLQYRIKWNLAAVRAVAVTAFGTGTLTFTLVAEIMEGAQTPQGCMTYKQHYQFTTAASGVEYIDLPLDRRMRGLMVRSSSASGGGLYGISNVRLSCDQGKFVPFDLRKTDLQRMDSLKNAPYHYKHLFYCKDGDTLYPLLKQDESLSLLVNSGDTVYGYNNNGIGNGVITMKTAGSAAGAEIMTTSIVEGWSPFHCEYIDLGEYDDPASWLDLTMFRAARLELTQDNASASASVVLCQELVY